MIRPWLIGPVRLSALACPLVMALVMTLPAAAQDGGGKTNLGVYDNWAAFTKTSPRHCYAIAKPAKNGTSGAFATIATWPEQGIKRQLHLRLSRKPGPQPALSLRIGNQRYPLTANGRDAWVSEERDNPAIIAALRSASTMRVSGRARSGRRFVDSYPLKGVATAMDASALACAK